MPLSASDAPVALYFKSVMNDAKTFTTVKATSAAIAFYHYDDAGWVLPCPLM